MKHLHTSNSTYVLLLLLTCSTICPTRAFAQTETKPLDRMKWLLGLWQMPVKKGILYEGWRYVNDSTFQSRSYIIKAIGDTIPQESVQLAYRNGIMYYIPTVKGQNNEQPVQFKITLFTGKEFVCENPGHDFPQRIGYKLVAPGEIYAWIDGTYQGKYSKEEYRMKIVK